jgi:hypothetical protein
MTDSLSSLTALEKVFPTKNSMEHKLLNMLAEKRESLKLMWVPAYTGIEGNNEADEAAKYALNEDILPKEMNWKRWLKNTARKILENKWMTSENAMVQIKPNKKKYNCTQNLSRHDQVVVSRLRMVFTRITQEYRLDNSNQPECQTPNMSENIISPHILWECRSFEPQRVRYEIDQQILADTVERT